MSETAGKKPLFELHLLDEATKKQVIECIQKRGKISVLIGQNATINLEGADAMAEASLKSTNFGLDSGPEQTAAVGLAYSQSAVEFIARESGVVDYVEIPFEHLVHDPSAIEIRNRVPVVLHCASLSIAGNVPPPPGMTERLVHWISETETPWLGEHLAYVRADGLWREIAEHPAFASTTANLGDPAQTSVSDCHAAPEPPFNVGYSVSPQLSDEILGRVVRSTQNWESQLGLPVLLENGPVYFEMPGSTMSQFEFIQQLCARSPGQLLLLDLAHFVITCSNIGVNPFTALESLPLEHIVEIHLSGAKHQSGILWDDHSEPVSELVFELLSVVLRRSHPRAITLEYNWNPTFPIGRLEQDVYRAKQLVSSAVN